jgi:hypothetical protein
VLLDLEEFGADEASPLSLEGGAESDGTVSGRDGNKLAVPGDVALQYVCRKQQAEDGTTDFCDWKEGPAEMTLKNCLVGRV